MAYFAKLQIEDVEYLDFNNVSANDRTGYGAGDCRASFRNTAGDKKTTFNIADDTKILLGGVPCAGLKCYYTLDDTPNDVLGLHNGSWTGTPAYSTGMINNGYTNGGTANYITVGDLGFIETTPVTISVWFKLTAAGADTPTAQVLVTTNHIYMQVRGSTELVTIRYDNTAARTSTYALGAGDTNWHHAVGVFDGVTTTKLYVDGILRDRDTHAAGPTTTYDSDVSSIGRRATGYFNGQIDEVAISNTIWTADQVSKAYNAGSPRQMKVKFRGVIEKIDFQTIKQQEYLIISGRDYLAVLHDKLIQYETFSSQEVSTIVTNLMSSYVPEIGVVNVDVTSTTLTRITFKNKSVYDALVELAEASGFIFYVDTDKDLHFELQNSVSSNLTFDTTNIVNTARFSIDEDDMFNDIWVYGGTNRVHWTENFTANGGSLFTLGYKPHNTYVTDAGTKRMGNILGISSTYDSGTAYLVNYDAKQVLFISGTTNGAFIPTSGNAKVVAYDRDRPVIKNASDFASITTYGKKTKVIQNEAILDPRQAADIASDTLALIKEPFKMSNTLNIQGVFDLTVGNTAIINLPYQNISNETHQIIQINYDIDHDSLNGETVASVRVGNRIKDMSDKLKQLILEVRALQAQAMDDPEIFTRLYQGNGSFGIRTQSWYFKTRNIGSGWVVGASNNSYVGSTLVSAYVGSGGATQFATVLSGVYA